MYARRSHFSACCVYKQRSHLFELLCLSLTDRWLEDMHLQLGQISRRDLQWELRLLAPQL